VRTDGSMRYLYYCFRQPAAKIMAALSWAAMTLAVSCPVAAFAQTPAGQSGGLTADVSACLLKPRHVIQLGSPVFGVLKGVFVDRADAVKEGQVVAKLDTTVEEAQVALDHYRLTNVMQIEAAKIDLAWNQRELERRQKLAGNMFSKANEIDEFITKVEHDRIAIRKAESDLEVAKLESARSDAQLNLKIIRSPVNGIVTELKLAPGEFIYEQTPIMTVAEMDPLTVDLVVPSERLRSVKLGMIGQLHLLAPVDRTFPAQVDAIDQVIDPASDTFRIRLALPNPGYVIPAGIRCSVKLPDAEAGE
jgi:membrane fusion protein, multidrug efflux system